MSSKLNITAVPFRSSRLAIPPSPFSPLLPITPTSPPRTTSASPNIDLAQHLPPPSQSPLPWIWKCHICDRRYSLGVTRRCLDDGHYFCSGTSTVRRRDGTKRLRRHKPCGNEFDYRGWKDWGNWRRRALVLSDAPKPASPCDSVFEDDSEDEMVDVTEITDMVTLPGTLPQSTAWRRQLPMQVKPVKDCWNRCNYPSECRWGKQYGLHSPTPTTSTFPTLISMPKDTDIEMSDAPPATDFNTILTRDQQLMAETVDGVEDSQTPVPALSDLANLVSRAQRRHSRSEPPPSPLATSVATAEREPRTLRSMASRESLRRAVEGLGPDLRRGIGALASLVGAWRSASAPPTARLEESLDEGGVVGHAGRRRSFG